MPTDRAVNKFRKNGPIRKSGSTPIFRILMNEYQDQVLKSYRSANDINIDCNDLEINDEHMQFKSLIKIIEPIENANISDFKMDPYIVPKNI